ncbi:hypothetical protein VPHF86_0136 [Vibrio phage F86]
MRTLSVHHAQNTTALVVERTIDIRGQYGMRFRELADLNVLFVEKTDGWQLVKCRYLSTETVKDLRFCTIKGAVTFLNAILIDVGQETIKSVFETATVTATIHTLREVKL